jgi:hypothetical protein
MGMKELDSSRGCGMCGAMAFLLGVRVASWPAGCVWAGGRERGRRLRAGARRARPTHPGKGGPLGRSRWVQVSDDISAECCLTTAAQ